MLANSLSKYIHGVTPQIAYYLAKLGLTDADIAATLKVHPRTFDTWKVAHPELREAMKPAKDFIDSMVEGHMLRRAFGYDYEEVTREQVEVGKNTDGSPKLRMKVTKRMRKHQPGDVVAMIFWLKNRKPADWKDRNHLVVEDRKLDYSKFTDEQLRELAALEAVADGNNSGRN